MSKFKDIISGPAKEELKKSFLNRAPIVLTISNKRKKASRIKVKLKIYLRLVSLEFEDGSGESFNFHGRDIVNGKNWSGNYSTKTKKGTMCPV